MPERGRVLLADDEPIFLDTTADLLRLNGYECDSAIDVAMAASMLRLGAYDVLVADIRMKGNSRLQLIRELDESCRGVQVILVTGCPSVRVPLDSLRPEVDFIVKPFEIEHLVEKIAAAIASRHANRRSEQWRMRVDEFYSRMRGVEDARRAPEGPQAVTMTEFIDASFQGIVSALLDWKHVMEERSACAPAPRACHLFRCPRIESLSSAVRETIAALEKTKHAFKSRELKELRERLEALLRDHEERTVVLASGESENSQGAITHSR